MPVATKVTLTGDRAIASYLRALGPKLSRGPVRRAITQSGQAISKASKAIVPVETGALKRALSYKVKAFRNGQGYYALVGARKDVRESGTRPSKKYSRFAVRKSKRSRAAGWIIPHKYLHLVHGGTRPHAVGKGSSLRRGVQVGMMHPGSRARPFLTEAHSMARNIAYDFIRERLREALRKAGRWQGFV